MRTDLCGISWSMALRIASWREAESSTSTLSTSTENKDSMMLRSKGMSKPLSGSYCLIERVSSKFLIKNFLRTQHFTDAQDHLARGILYEDVLVAAIQNFECTL